MVFSFYTLANSVVQSGGDKQQQQQQQRRRKMNKPITMLSLPLLIILFLSFGYTSVEASYASNGLLYVELDDEPKVRWLEQSTSTQDDEPNKLVNNNLIRRKKRTVIQPDYIRPNLFSRIKSDKCQQQIKTICVVKDETMNDLFYLKCIQSFKPEEVNDIDDECQHLIYQYIRDVSSNENIQKMTRDECGNELDKMSCPLTQTPGSYLSCLKKRVKIADSSCSKYIRHLDGIVNDYKIQLILTTLFFPECQNEIDKFQCGRIQPYKDVLQRQILTCLQQHLNKLGSSCRKRIPRVTEIQVENNELDQQLYAACSDDHKKFCRNITPGSDKAYKCLMQHKLDISMTTECQDQLARREKLIASDYRVSRGLVRACKEDIKTYRCRRNVSDDKDIRLAQILLCLESSFKNGSKVTEECKKEIFEHRQMLWEDYRLKPEFVNQCANDIRQFCNNLEVGGATIHCLMEYTRLGKMKNRARVSSICQRALEDLIKETDAGEDWRIDPVLREACQSVVDLSCKDVQGGDARIISCLMDKLGTDRMSDNCETALVQIQYFIARDYKLDPQLYKACKDDAYHFCSARKAWSNDGTEIDIERGPLVLPCLYRYAYHPQKNMTLKRGCLDEIRRVMRQRAVNVDLQPEIEEVCLDDLATFCFDKTAKGEEILCLQDKYDSLTTNCKLAVGNFTEEQAERVELNPVITTACRHVMERHCEELLKFGKDEGDMMECLIEHKNDLDSRTDMKCKAAIEHFQLISLKDYHFTFKFKESCRPMVIRWCPQAKTKHEVIGCLSDIVQRDVIQDSQFRISRECRQQLRTQLYQQRENIKFDPKLYKTCAEEIKQLCFNVEPGNAQVLECLAINKPRLGEECHAQLFRVRKQEFVDSSSDYALLHACHDMVKQFCHDVDRSKTLDCLKRYKDDLMFDDKCKTFVVNRMAEQNTDYRFNTPLRTACTLDMARHCKKELEDQPINKESKGKVIACLKSKFKESKLTMKCEHQMEIILREAALNYHLNPLIATLCADEIDKLCKIDDSNSPGKVEECLKSQFIADNKDMKEECRIQVAEMIAEAKADINVDPLLQKACAVDVSKFCADVPHGAGRHIKCLENILLDEKRSLQPDCYKMLTSRMQMFEKITAPKTFEELYDSVNRSPAKFNFLLITITIIGIIFIFGMFCGRVSRRTMLMKNK